MEIVEQACPHCGQFIAVEIAEGTPEWEREKLAEGRCNCPAAQRVREIAEAMGKLEQVCGTISTERGFDGPLDSETMDVCRRAVEWAVDGMIREVQIKCLSGDVVTISEMGSPVKIKRKCQKQVTL